ncbi:MAG: C1 family peptidase [Bdellovibrionota bacterium]
MKVLVFLVILLSLGLQANAGEFGVDLDSQFIKATGTLSRLQVLDSGTWDGSGAFPPIVVQKPFGACQTFSMTAMMEYLFYRQTGKTLKLSEKQLAYNLLKLMTGQHWDKEKNQYENEMTPQLGHGIAPLVIETVAQNGLMPNADYPWGDFSAANGSRSIDAELFERIFDVPEKAYTQEEYTRYLDEAFLSTPPKFIRYVYKQMDFSSGKEEEIIVKTPLELAKIAGFDKAKFKVLHNAEMDPMFQPMTPETKKQVLEWFESEAQGLGVNYETTTKDKIISAVMASLNSRMVVLLATDVWVSSWKDKLVYSGGGGHGVVIVGYQYRNGDLYFKLRNSWGTDAGIDGYNYVKASVLMPNLLYVILYDVG